MNQYRFQGAFDFLSFFAVLNPSLDSNRERILFDASVNNSAYLDSLSFGRFLAQG
jgi:hypothetical protein